MDKDKAWAEGYHAAKNDEYARCRTQNPYEIGTDLYRYWQNGYKSGEEDLRYGWYNESITNRLFNFILREAKGFDNDERYSHAPKKDLSEIRDLLLDANKLTKYFWNNQDILKISCYNLLADAIDESEISGYKGFYSEAIKVFDSGTDKIFDITSLVNPDEEITLYRGVELVGDADPDIDHPGVCWTYDKQTAIDFVSQFDDDDPNKAPCILTGKTKVSNIDWLISVLLISDEPDEKEIRIWDDSQIDIIDTEVL